jgi:pre-rRNA-processing protein TSR1
MAASHHHRSTTKQSQKPFKSRHATKGALKELSKGKVEAFERGSRKTPHQQVMSKLSRRNQAKQLRVKKDQEHAKATNVFQGKDGAPRIVAVVPLCHDVSAAKAVQSLNAGLDMEEEIPEAGWVRMNIERFKQKVQYLVVKRDLLAALDACRVADFIVFVLSCEEEVDQEGQHILKAIESQGVSNCFTVVQGLDSAQPPKRRPQIVASLKSYITHYLPTTERVFSLDSRQESSNLVRSICSTSPKGVRWREQRSYMFIEDVVWPSGKSAMTEEGTGQVMVTGVVRGQGLKADRLIQVGDWGDFQVERITAAPLEVRKKGSEESMAVDTDAVLEEPTEEQDDLAELAPEEAVMEDAGNDAISLAPTERRGVLLDDHHYFSDEEETIAAPRAQRIPKGTSQYQSAWYIDDFSDSGSDLEDIDDEFPQHLKNNETFDPADGLEGLDLNGRAITEGGPSEYPQSEMFLDPSPEDEAEQIAEYRKTRKTEADEDLEFPDEIELHPNVDARERLARYRGLKSLRNSVWETEEDKPHEPEDWPRLLEISDYKRTATKILREAWIGGVRPGTRVNIYLRGVPLALQDQSRPVALFSLLRHEHKRTCCNYSISLNSEYPEPIKSKAEMVVQCGPRRMVINPLFSQAGNTPNNVHKFDRFLHPGRSAIASFIGPLTWGSVPVLYFQRTKPSEDDEMGMSEGSLELIATGTSLPSSLNRVIAKRVILTGHPLKINKRIVTVRYMFFSDRDVKWFKSLPLWTKRGRSGFIKESLGTHGYFKATFDGKINPMDAIAVSLYKRVWPRPAKAWKQ